MYFKAKKYARITESRGRLSCFDELRQKRFDYSRITVNVAP